MRIWQTTLIFLLITVGLSFFFGSAKQAVVLIFIYLFLSLLTYLIGRKRKMTAWQERVLVYLVAFPGLSFVIPWQDLLGLFIGSIIACFIIFISENRKLTIHDGRK